MLNSIARLFGNSIAKRFDAEIRFGRRLNLKSPETLADKVSWLEIYRSRELKVRCTDKYAVRNYVLEKGLGEILIPLAGGPWTSEQEVNFDALPGSFVIKATHGCKMNCIVPDKAKLDIPACGQQMRRWLSTAYGSFSVEPHYLGIPRRLYAETLLCGNIPLRDYKFHCLNGIAQFVLVCSDRQCDDRGNMRVRMDTFDMDWKPIAQMLPCRTVSLGDGSVPKPETFDEMRRIAGILSADFRFVRIDLYEVAGRVYFGEMTFTPACGVFPYYSEPFLREMGKRLDIDR